MGFPALDKVAALDLGKAELVCCVLGGDGAGGVIREVTTWTTMTGALTGLAEHLVSAGVELVAMEATSDYWRPVFYRLEAHGLVVMLVNAKHFKHLPGRPKTDVLDAVWLARLASKGLLRPSFVPGPDIRRLRSLTRDRADLADQRAANKNRVEKLLEDACVKLSVVASDIFGVSGRAMMEALIAGQRDPAQLAEMSKGALRSKKARLVEALNGFFTDHHGFRLRLMLDRIDQIDADIATLDTRIAQELEPHARQIEQLCAIPGVSRVTAAAILAEIGVDMTRFATPGHLASWAKYAPGVNESAGKRKGSGSTGKGNPYLARALGQTATATRLTKTFLGDRYRRLSRRIGKKKAQTAVGRSILVGIWHVLSHPANEWHDLGPDHHTTRHPNTEQATTSHIKALQQLGYTVTLTPTT